MTPISIVTTSLNHAHFLPETLDSVQSQHYPALQHLIIDGGSTDGTLPLLESKQGPNWQHLHWQSGPDGGQTQAMNKGLRRASGDIIGWLNSDDRYRPGCLHAVARAFDDNPAIDVLYGDYTFMDEHGAHIRNRREIEFSRLVLLYHRVPHIPTTATFFRRRIFDEGNWLDESLQYAMDHEFFVRLAVKGYRFQHLPTLLADFRLHPASKTCSMAYKQLIESRAAMHKHSPVALHIHNKPLRTVCLAAMQTAAAIARCSEKLLRGYYLPDRFIERERPVH
jgi:glycosyltransferase involved in cell wall biosynthesis